MGKKINIEMGNMVGKTYFQVANWFNKDFETERQRQEGLKEVCVEIIQHILEDTFMQLDGVEATGVKVVKEENIKNTEPNSSGTIFNINEEAIIKGLNNINSI